MWPFKKKPKAPHASPLSAAEQAWLDEQRAALGTLSAAAGLVQAGNRLEASDALISWWRRQPEPSRPDPNPIVNAAGVALGDALAKDLGLEWKIITDAFGTDLGLWRAQGSITLSPTHSVARNFATGPDDLIAQLFENIRAGARQAFEATAS